MVNVTAVGMITSVGWDAPTACASIRAGLSRPAEVDDFEVADLEEMRTVPLTGHPIANYTDGFVMVGRWHRLFDGAVESLLSTDAVPALTAGAFWRATGIMVVTSRLRDRRYGTDNDRDVDTSFVQRMVERNFGHAIPPALVAAVPAGRVGMIDAVEAASQWFAERNCVRVLVVAVDSYLDPMTLEWLFEHGRLKDNDRPAGVSPGEAGACLLLETEAAAAARQTPVLMRLPGIGRGTDYSIYDEQRNVGRGLANAVNECLDRADLRSALAGDIVTDLNGEAWRAAEYGGGRVLLRPRISDDMKEVLPALSVGDVGSASAAVGLCVAARSFVRGYATGEHVLILSSTERGESAAFLARAGGR
jgi:3-oxoacyl-[acyl-carrier-protein] synthase-1